MDRTKVTIDICNLVKQGLMVYDINRGLTLIFICEGYPLFDVYLIDKTELEQLMNELEKDND